ncbi:ArsR family transcriptional regulator [Planomonospora parontospora]|uniref:ArsR family transcriptional regulator n=2 Tax=Planomonospora parontospora TaxID=58119 RepID=A0AA37BI92_9ACTN|nr:metalloregulator ArsR/SmtB family transcription factor [Planomonospora parontospora]GGK76328.1 ArsR family transcriptional regulator [Planomonospora parontospora]
MVGDPARKASLFDQIARVGKALGHGKRLELLDLLAQGERSVEILAQTAGLGVTSTSAHLQTLKQGGLVSTRREGTRVLYRLAGDDVVDLYARLRNVAATHLADVQVAVAAYLGEHTEEVTREELLERAASGQITVLDVRPYEEFEAGHIPGAVCIPIDELPDRLNELPVDAEIVAYCRGAYCVFAPEAVRLLAGRGMNAKRLADGMLEWQVAGLPMESGGT